MLGTLHALHLPVFRTTLGIALPIPFWRSESVDRSEISSPTKVMLESGGTPLQTQASLAPRVLLLLSLDSALSSLFPVWQDAFEKVGKTNVSREMCHLLPGSV